MRERSEEMVGYRVALASGNRLGDESVTHGDADLLFDGLLLRFLGS